MMPVQYKAYRFIKAYIGERGFPPAYGEIADAVGFASKSGVHRIVTGLEARGLIRRQGSRARSIELVDPAMDAAPNVALWTSAKLRDVQRQIAAELANRERY
jgi:SOS-response transcriptional repressor LexA